MQDKDDLYDCYACGDGEYVPSSGYYRCPNCDAEWMDEDEQDED